MNKSKEEIMCLSFNCDRSYLAAGTTRGFKIFSLEPFELRKEQDFAERIVLIEMIMRSNLIAMVREGSCNKLRIYDDYTKQHVAESTFKSEIKAMRIRQRKICIALVNKIFVLNFSTLDVEHAFDTCDNQEGMLSINNDPKNLIMAIPSKVVGSAILCNFQRNTQTIIKAHKSTLSLLEISDNGHKLATVSEKGIKIRIYNTKNGQIIQELRRGNQFATVYSVSFDPTSQWLTASSDSCNVHIFAVKLTDEEKQQNDKLERENPKSLFYFMRNIIPYFDNDHSFSCFKIPNYETDLVSKVIFPNTIAVNNIVVATSLGPVYFAEFDTKTPGICKTTKQFNMSK